MQAYMRAKESGPASPPSPEPELPSTVWTREQYLLDHTSHTPYDLNKISCRCIVFVNNAIYFCFPDYQWREETICMLFLPHNKPHYYYFFLVGLFISLCFILFSPYSPRWTTCSWKSVLSKVLSRPFSSSGWMLCWPVCPIGSARGPAGKSCLKTYAKRSVRPTSESWPSTEVSPIDALVYIHRN